MQEPPLQTEQPWRRWTWIGTCDARVLGLFRLGLGAVVLFDLLDRMRDLRVFYTDQGVAPRAQVLESWVRAWRFSLFDAAGTPLIVYGLFALGMACVVLFTVGWRTRLMTALSWVFVMSLDERNLVLLDGGDGVMRIMLFWMMWADSGAAYSLDAAWGRRTSPGDGRAPALPLRVLQGQIMFVYAMAAITKSGVQWRDGTALYHALQLSDWARPLGQWMLNYPSILDVLTRSTVWVEAGFCFLVLIPVGAVRALAILMVLGLHAGIFVTMRVGLFSTMMPVTMTLFLLPGWIDFAERRLKRGPNPKRYAGPRGSRFWQTILVMQFLAVLWTQGATRLQILPKFKQVVQWECELLSLWQNWAMFAPNPLGEDGHWSGPGHAANGQDIDVLEAVAEPMLPDHGWYFRRWVKYRSELYADTYNGALRMFAGWVCREYNRDKKPELMLVDYELIYWQQPTHAPGEPDRPIKRLLKWHHNCGVTPIAKRNPSRSIEPGKPLGTASGQPTRLAPLGSPMGATPSPSPYPSLRPLFLPRK